MRPEDKDAMAMQTWEYRVTSDDSEEQMNGLGADGWELVAVRDTSSYWKRPVLGFKERVTLEQRETYARLRGERLEG